MEHLFIINPIAGKGSTMKFIPEIKNFFNNNGGNYKIEITKCPGDAKRIAQEYIGNSKDEDLRIYSVGGDGTLNEVLNGMFGSNCSLAVIPSGTGNDFIKSIAPNYNIKTILENTINGSEKLIDCAMVNDRYFINISSIGLDADVLADTLKYKKNAFLHGKMVYIASIIDTLFKCKNKDKHMEVQIDDKTFNIEAFLIAIANGKCYGSGVTVSPDSVVDDGELNIVYISPMSVSKMIKLLPKFAKGKHKGISQIHSAMGKNIHIKCGNNIFMNIDGEIIETDEADFKILPKSLKFVIPKINI